MTDSPNPGIWGLRVKECRLEKRLTQQGLGTIAGGISAATISVIEAGGNTTTETLQRLADALGVALWQFFMPKDDATRLLSPAQVETVVNQVSLQMDTMMRRALFDALTGLDRQ